MNLELCAPNEGGTQSTQITNPIALFRADSEGCIQFVSFTSSGAVSFPLEELERAIAAAKDEVHSESYYDDPCDT